MCGPKNTEESVATARRLMELLDVRGNGMLRREDFTVDSACLEVYAEFSSNLPMDGATFNAAHGSVPRLDAGDPFSTSAAEGGQDQAPPMMTPGTRMQLPGQRSCYTNILRVLGNGSVKDREREREIVADARL